MKWVLTLTVVAIAVSFFAWLCGVTGLRLAILGSGLEGTALLASAFWVTSTDLDSVAPRGRLRRIAFWFGEGSSYGLPVHYNPVCYYGGLALLAMSMTMSVLNP